MGQQRVLFLLALFMLATLYYKSYFHPQSVPEEIYEEIVVEVLGEVQKPGVYIFKAPPILREAIEKAGGFKEPALLNSAEFSQVLETGTQLSILKESQRNLPPSSLTHREDGAMKQAVIKIRIGRMDANKLLVFSLPLDLNRVSVEDLCLIPGIGESLAREIVAYRERRKMFSSVEELKKVKGIEEKKYQSFKIFFTVRP
jgi:competence protein ComEA